MRVRARRRLWTIVLLAQGALVLAGCGAGSDAPEGSEAHHLYIRPILERHLEGLPSGARVLDLGCRTGTLLGSFQDRGWIMEGLDIYEPYIQEARARFPAIRFHVGDATVDLGPTLGRGKYAAIISTEVIEHVYDPRGLVRNAYELLKPGGIFVLSTPYHGYSKNLLIALTGRGDFHYNPLQDNGHIKFFSFRTMRWILEEAGFRNLDLTGAGRAPLLWKSMVVSATKPGP